MAETGFMKFRSALNGFNRTDVVSFIEQRSQEYTTKLQQLQDEVTQAQNNALNLAHENTRLLNEMQSLRDTLDQLQAEKPEPEMEISEEPEAMSAPTSETPDWSAAELAAYRRAEATERNAMTRAGAISRQVTGILASAQSRFQVTGSDASALCEDLQELLTRLQESLSEIQTIYEDTTASFETLNLNPSVDEQVCDEL